MSIELQRNMISKEFLFINLFFFKISIIKPLEIAFPCQIQSEALEYLFQKIITKRMFYIPFFLFQNFVEGGCL